MVTQIHDHVRYFKTAKEFFRKNNFQFVFNYFAKNVIKVAEA
jgi:hypothetical protein